MPIVRVPLPEELRQRLRRASLAQAANVGYAASMARTARLAIEAYLTSVENAPSGTIATPESPKSST